MGEAFYLILTSEIVVTIKYPDDYFLMPCV